MKKILDKWNDWVMEVISGGSVEIMVNGEVGSFFKTHHGLRQGYPLSPLLFDLAVDALSILVGRAVNQGLITGLATHKKKGDVAILQYADDTILLIKDYLEQARN